MSKYLWIVIASALVSVFIVWTPFVLKLDSFWGIKFEGTSMLTIAQNYDGLNFLVVARSWYNPEIILSEYSQLVGERGARYFAAHYPAYSVLIGFFDWFVDGVSAIYLSIVVSNILLAIGLYLFFVTFAPRHLVLPLALIALFVPARMMPLRAIGSNELLCLFFILTSLVNFYKGRTLLASVLGSLAVLTRSPAILLFVGYALNNLIKYRHSPKDLLAKSMPILLMPLSLITLWGYYGVIYGDILAYFRVGGNLNLYLPPFMSFASELPWISGFWREDIMYLYVFLIVGVALLWEQTKKNMIPLILPIFASIYAFSLFFVAHRDVSRYSILIAPLLTLAIAPHVMRLRYHKWILALLLPLFLYSWNFILGNIQPIADWTPFL